MKNKRLYLLIILLIAVLFCIYRLKELPHRIIPLQTPSTTTTASPAQEINENLKDTLNLYLNSPAPYASTEKTEKENDLLMKLGSEFENRIDLSTFIYTFEHSAPNRKCSSKENTYECFAEVEKNSGWKLILTSPSKNQLHFEKIYWEVLK